MFGLGLLKGLAVTGKESVSKRLTEKYPEEKPFLASRWRGGFQFDAEACIACGLCEKACPNNVIECGVGKNEEGKKVLESYVLNQHYCLFCGFCVEACPKHCLRFTKDFESAAYLRSDIPLDLMKDPNLDAETSTYGQPEVVAAKPEAVAPAESGAEATANTEVAKAAETVETTEAVEASEATKEVKE